MVSDVTVTKNSPGTISAYHSEVPSWARTFGAPKNVTSPNTVAIEIRYDHATREPRHDAYARIKQHAGDQQRRTQHDGHAASDRFHRAHERHRSEQDAEQMPDLARAE